MKSSMIIAIAAAGALGSSAAACPLPGFGTAADAASKPAVRTLLTTSTTSSCTPRMYWFPAECTSDRSVASAEKARHNAGVRGTATDAETCLPRIYWFPAHCQ